MYLPYRPILTTKTKEREQSERFCCRVYSCRLNNENETAAYGKQLCCKKNTHVINDVTNPRKENNGYMDYINIYMCVCVGNSSVAKIYIIRPKPGPVAKNATPRPSGWESNPRPLDAEGSGSIPRRPWSCIFRNWSRFGSYNVYLCDTRIYYTL